MNSWIPCLNCFTVIISVTIIDTMRYGFCSLSKAVQRLKAVNVYTSLPLVENSSCLVGNHTTSSYFVFNVWNKSFQYNIYRVYCMKLLYYNVLPFNHFFVSSYKSNRNFMMKKKKRIKRSIFRKQLTALSLIVCKTSVQSGIENP